MLKRLFVLAIGILAIGVLVLARPVDAGENACWSDAGAMTTYCRPAIVMTADGITLLAFQPLSAAPETA
jgi:hypothetical protein